MALLRFKFIVPFVVLFLMTPNLVASVPDEVKRLLRLSDFEAAAAELRRAANQGSADAAYELGKLYLRGHAGTPRNDGAARRFEQAATEGHTDAAYQLGRLYERGNTVTQNQKLALRWYGQAADLAHTKAHTAIKRLSASDAVATISMDAALAKCSEQQIRQALRSESPYASAWMYKAIECGGSVAMFEEFIRAGHDLASVDGAGNTVLHVAIARDEANAVQALVKAGADPDTKNASGWSAEMLAQRSTSQPIRQQFQLTQPVSPQQGLDLERAAEEERFTGWPPLTIAAWQGDLALTAQLLRAGSDINLLDPAEFSALDRALQRGEMEVVTTLLEADARLSGRTVKLMVNAASSVPELANEFAERASQQGQADNLLCESLKLGNSALAETIIADGGQFLKTCDGKSPLLLAAKAGALRVVAAIARDADVNEADDTGCTALCWALRKDHIDIAHSLLLQGADNRSDAQGETPLMQAAHKGDLGGVQLLVEQDIDVNQQSQSGTHALILAAAGGHYSVVDYLLANNAAIDQKDGVGDTALIVAVREENLEVAKLLVASGASTRARNEKFESARELVKTKNASWRDVIEKQSSMWGLVN